MWKRRIGSQDANGNVLNLDLHDAFTPDDIRELKSLRYASQPNQFKVVTDYLKKDQMDALVELLKTYAKRKVIWNTIELEDDNSQGRSIPSLVRVVNSYQLCSHLKLTSQEDWEDFNTDGKHSHFLACLSKNHRLQSLEVHFNFSFCTEGDLTELCRVLRTSSTLEELTLLFPEEKEFRTFLPSVGKNTSLKTINLGLPEKDSDQWFQALVSEICGHPQLRGISIDCPKMGNDGLRALGFLLDSSQLDSLFVDCSLSGSPEAYLSMLKGLASQKQMSWLGLPRLIDGLNFADAMQVVLQMDNLDRLQIGRYQKMEESDLARIATSMRSRRTNLEIDLPRSGCKDHADCLERILVAHPGIHFSHPLADLPKDSGLRFRNRFNYYWRFVQTKPAIWPWALGRAKRHPSVVFDLLKGKVLGGRESLEEPQPGAKQVVSRKRKLCELNKGNIITQGC